MDMDFSDTVWKKNLGSYFGLSSYLLLKWSLTIILQFNDTYPLQV